MKLVIPLGEVRTSFLFVTKVKPKEILTTVNRPEFVYNNFYMQSKYKANLINMRFEIGCND